MNRIIWDPVLRKFRNLDGYGYGEQFTGFINNELITIDYTYNSHVTLSSVNTNGFIEYLFNGKLHKLSSPWISPQIEVGENMLYLQSADGLTFNWFTEFNPYALLVAIVIPGRQFALRGCYGVMQPTIRAAIHNLVGAVLGGGGLVEGTYEIDTDTDDANNPSFAEAGILDVDLGTEILQWPEDSYTHLWISSGNSANFEKVNNNIVRVTGTYPDVNQDGTAMIEAGPGKYLCYYVVRMPVTHDDGSQDYRCLILQPQRSFDTLIEAQAENPNNLNSAWLSLIKKSFVISDRLIYKTDESYTTTGKVRLADYSMMDIPDGWVLQFRNNDEENFSRTIVEVGDLVRFLAGNHIHFDPILDGEKLIGIEISGKSNFFNGIVAPDEHLGVNDDYYLKTNTGQFYQKIEDAWVLIYTFGSGGNFTYIAYASDDTGTDFTLEFNPGLNYIGIINSGAELTPVVGDFAGKWKRYVGADGDDGITPTIGENGNWYIGITDTGIKAQGEDGDDGVSPHIGENGNWFIGLTDTGVKAQGEDGDDGTSAFVYVAYASSNSGTGFSLTPTDSLKYRAEIHTIAALSPPVAGDFAAATWVKYIGDDGAGGGDAFEVYIDFLELIPFVYNCPYAVVFTSQISEGTDATLSTALNTNMAQFQKLTVTPTQVGLIILVGELL